MRVTLKNVLIHLLNWRGVIEDPDAATVCCQDQIVVARVNFDVVYGHVRQVLEFESGPVLSRGVRHEQAELRACIKQVGVLRIFPNYLDVGSGWQVTGNVAPRLSAVRSFENIRTKIIEHVTVKRCISHARIRARWFDMRNGRVCSCLLYTSDAAD